jgi:shikimate kinase
MLGTGGGNRPRSTRVALIGLRGAGKSTLGQMLADDLGFPFVELSREIEKFAGCSISEIQGLYGQNAYRRYERRALEEAIQIYPEAVIATPGGIVSDPATFNQLLAHCTTVWLQADPEDHMRRVTAQGDLRPMAASREAMEDLKGILAGRAAFYSKAEFRLDTSAQALEPTFAALRSMVRQALRCRPDAQHIAFCLTIPYDRHYDAVNRSSNAHYLAHFRRPRMSNAPRVDYQTHPSRTATGSSASKARWPRWRPTSTKTPACARLQAQAQQLRPGRGHRAERRHPPHPLRAPRGAHRGAHQRQGPVFCSGANIFMLGCPATPGR